MNIVYRPAKPVDLRPAVGVVFRAGNDLRTRNGGVPAPAPQQPHFQAFCLAENPGGLWVAEADGTIVGFGCAWMIGAFWFLSQLFIEPGLQAKGVGQALMSRTLDMAERNGADNRTLITLAYCPASAPMRQIGPEGGLVSRFSTDVDSDWLAATLRKLVDGKNS